VAFEEIASIRDEACGGRDARHGSERFNDEVVEVLLGAAATVFEMPGALPTPFVPYCREGPRAARRHDHRQSQPARGQRLQALRA